jgi:hypothetical protein
LSGLTPRVERRVRADFEDADFALAALRDWRISYMDELPGERLVAAAVLYADGDLDELGRAFDLADSDWRDLLVAARLADPDWPRTLTELLP